MPAEQRELFQGIVDEFYDNFMTVVTDHRPAVSEADLRAVTDGRIITGVRAAETGVVDRTGDLYTAFEAAKQRAGVPTARLIKYHRPLEHVGSAYSYAPGAPGAAPTGATGAGTEVNLLQLNLPAGPYESTGFYYLWDPSVW